jgi:tripartite-type tricarboxylate transporter receptor subunit TctC
VDQARAKPGEINYASGGIGSSAHMSMELLKYQAHVDLNHVPYKGATPALTDIIGGQVPVMFVNLTPAIGHIRAGKVRLLAVTTSKRWPSLPDTPTVAEAGVEGFETVAWFGLLAPAATPRPVIDKLHAEVTKVLAQADVRERIATTGSEVVGNTPQEFARRIQTDVDKWKKVAAAANIKAD